MRAGWPQTIIMLSGTFLIFVGVVVLCAQLYAQLNGIDPIGPDTPNEIRLMASEVRATTRFGGIELVAIGAVLQIIGYLGTRPWKKSED
jgi:uncharacterized membrane protein